MTLTLKEYLAVPYVLLVDSVQRADGEWVRRAEYPEIGCVCERATPGEAMAALDEARVRLIHDRFERGEPIPVPRSPLTSSAPVWRRAGDSGKGSGISGQVE